MNLDIYDSRRRKRLLEQLHDRFGIKDVPKFLFETGKEKIRGFSGDLTIDELYGLARITNIEFLGLYLFRADDERSVRMSFDACLLFAEQISKNILELNDEQLKTWMKGDNLPFDVAKGMYIVRHKGDFFGCAIYDGEKLMNFVPKERRLRKG